MPISERRGRLPFYQYKFMVNGKEYRGTTKRKDKAGANRVMAQEYEKVMNIRQHGEKPDITLHDAFELTVKSVEGRTRESYQNSMNKLLGLRPKFEGSWTLDQDRFLSDLDDDDLEDHRTMRAEEGFKQNSTNIEIRFLKRVNNLCKKKYKVNHDLDFVQPKGFAKSRILSFDEEAKVIAALTEKASMPDHEAYAKALDLFIFLIDTGVRLGEAVHVEWTDIDLKRGIIDNYNVKTRKQVLVPISDRLLQVLKRLHDQPHPFMSMDRAIKMLRKVIRAQSPSSDRVRELKGEATIHSCRDTYATRRLQDGLSLGEVSQLLGHASITQTQKYAKYEAATTVEKAKLALNRAAEL